MQLKEKWKDFFVDPNVRFPTYPKLLEEIHTYEAPYGLGVQFNGGPHPLIIRGRNVNPIFESLKKVMNGKEDWEHVVLKVSENYEIDEVVHVLRILQANSLLRDGSEMNGVDHVVDKRDASQKAYYNRVIGRTGFLKKGSQATRILSDVKVLLISNGMLSELLVEHMLRSGIRDITLYATDNQGFDNFKEWGVKANVLEHNGIKGIEAQLKEIVGNYRFVICGLTNPASWFLNALNRVAIMENVPTFYFTKEKENYEIGPYVIPKRSACIFCKTMRSNSYNDDAAIENSYQDMLEEQERIIGDSAKGEDYATTLSASTLFLSEVIKAITGHSTNGLVNSNLSYDSVNGYIRNQKILRIPGCPECT